jgi:hypothetical protein
LPGRRIAIPIQRTSHSVRVGRLNADLTHGGHSSSRYWCPLVSSKRISAFSSARSPKPDMTQDLHPLLPTQKSLNGGTPTSGHEVESGEKGSNATQDGARKA